MSSLETALDRAIFALVTHVSGRTIVLICFTLYPGLGLALPLGLHWSLLNLVSANLIGVMSAGMICVGWLVAQVEAGKRRRLVEWTTNLRLLSAEEFEWLVGEVFRREGWKVRETGQQGGPDGNIDLELSKNRQRRCVQCKRWTAWQVGVDEIRGFGGTLLREKVNGSDGIFVTLSDFTAQAYEEAERIGLTLIDGRELYRRVEQVRRVEACPICHKPMVLDRSTHGWWFRCVAANCAGKRDVANEPGRAVDFLTERPVLVNASGSN